MERTVQLAKPLQFKGLSQKTTIEYRATIKLPYSQLIEPHWGTLPTTKIKKHPYKHH